MLIAIVVLTMVTAADAGPWSMSLYGGRLSKDSLGDTFVGSAEYEDSYLAVFALSKEYYRYKDKVQVEIEGQIAKHFNYQDNWEFNIVPVVVR